MRAKPTQIRLAAGIRATRAHLPVSLAAAGILLLTCIAAAPQGWAAPHHAAQDSRRQASPLPAHPAPRPGYLGVSLRDMDAAEVMRIHLRGAMVVTVDRDAPAWTAGLRPSDVIVAINGQGVEGVEALRKRLRECIAGETITLHVWRDFDVTTVPVTLGDRDEIAENSMNQHLRSFGSNEPDAPQGSFAEPSLSAPASALQPAGADPHEGARGVASSLLEALTPGSLYTGLEVDPLTPQLAVYFGAHGHTGLLVTGVSDHSPGQAAGLRAGDVLLRADSRPLNSRSDLDHALHAAKGAPVTVTVLRDKHLISVSLTPGKKKKL